jgi:hypothetical protein
MAAEAAFAMHENVEGDDAPSSSSSLTKSDPVERAEAVAAAHAILANLSPDDIGGAGPLRSTAARAVHYSTLYSVAKWCRNVRSPGVLVGVGGRWGDGPGGDLRDDRSLQEGYHRVAPPR